MFGVNTGQCATGAPSSSRSRSIVQASELQLPASVQKLASGVVQYEQICQGAVPGLIVNNPLW